MRVYTTDACYNVLRILRVDFLLFPFIKALHSFEKKIRGFTKEAILVGIETRTSSPLRILRKKSNFHSTNINGLIPIGEGSGYAGGIVSSAVDAIKAVECFDS